MLFQCATLANVDYYTGVGQRDLVRFLTVLFAIPSIVGAALPVFKGREMVYNYAALLLLVMGSLALPMGYWFYADSPNEDSQWIARAYTGLILTHCWVFASVVLNLIQVRSLFVIHAVLFLMLFGLAISSTGRAIATGLSHHEDTLYVVTYHDAARKQIDQEFKKYKYRTYGTAKAYYPDGQLKSITYYNEEGNRDSSFS